MEVLSEVPPALLLILKKVTQGRLSSQALTLDMDLFKDLHFNAQEFELLYIACTEILRFVFIPTFQPLERTPPHCTLRELIFYAQPFYLLRPPPPEVMEVLLDYLIPKPAKGCLTLLLLFLLFPVWKLFL
jgi:hypothetical protein